MIEYRDLWKSFATPVLAGVTLEVHSGELLAIIGRSGSGKSVLLKLTIGLLAPERGDVRIDGDSVFYSNRRTLEGIRRKVGYLFQNAALFDSMNVLENVVQGLPESELAQLQRREVVLRAADALLRVDLDPLEVMARLPSELSGGMRKRVGLARAIVGRPRILLYDEPVTGLDPVTANIIHGLVGQLGHHLDATCVLVTHNVTGALQIADRVALLENGRIQFLGTPAEFRASPDPLIRAFLREDITIPEHVQAGSR
jgi:phospholipid/cholesterol/gamma-HCH transport system ATP-binding protein